jgi:hypothetical protein
VQGFDLDSLSSDIDLVPDMFYIPDPEYNGDMLIQVTSLLLPGAIQAVSQRLASTINDKTYPFLTISRYFIAKVRDLKVIGVDLLRHRQLIQQGDPPVFLHDDHPKLLFIVQSKFKAAKATYRSYKSQAQPQPEDQNIELIRMLMSDCINQYNNLLTQLDMLAVHHGLPLYAEGDAVDKMASLRSKSAQVKRRHELDSNLRKKTVRCQWLHCYADPSPSYGSTETF